MGRFYFMKRYTIEISEIEKRHLETKIAQLTIQLTDKDCQRVEFLRGKLSTYMEIIEETKWKDVERENLFF
jgi:hypothetical protein